MAKWRMKEQDQIQALLIELHHPFGGLIYDRCGERGEYRVTAERRGQPGRILLGIHQDRRTAYREALQYIREEGA